jgi:hypothetical protein
MKKFVFLFFLLIQIPSFTASAHPFLPFTKGLIQDKDNQITAVNLYGPAFYSGLRPGDFLVDPPSDENDRSLYAFNQTVRRENVLYNCLIIPDQIALPTQQSIFLLKKDRLAFSALLEKRQKDPFLSTVLPIKKIDDAWNLLYTEATITQASLDYKRYILSEQVPANLRITSVIFFTPTEHGTYQILNINCHFQAKDQNGLWQDIPSSGILTKEILQHLLT